MEKGNQRLAKSLFRVIKVWVWDQESENAKERLIIIRRVVNNIKYSLTNFSEHEASVEELAYIQGQRYWIERCFRKILESWV